MQHDEIVTPWAKSSYSNTGANCVEVACTSLGHMALRDSKDPGGPQLRFTPDEWTAFVSGIRSGKFE
ncbi:MAG TPA: DUF397 domain-containing protein [Streptosporangiaceae bacterium]|nr:DUF397 domain-containing protein [Streptosporangiaceae bacterium]